jgi:hypothetical protein
MDGYQFIASLFSSLVSLAWPVAFVIAVLLFRARFLTLLPMLRVKRGEWEASFQLDQAEQEAKQLPPAPPEAELQEPSVEEINRFDKLVAISPRAAILDLRSSIEESVRALAEARWPGKPYRGMWTTIRELKNADAFDNNTFALLDDLRVIGNAAAHPTSSTSFTEEDAYRFRSLAEKIIPRLHFAFALT